jgi:hypothetical protein
MNVSKTSDPSVDPQYIFTETNVSQTYSQNLPIEDLVKLADQIWADVKTHPDFGTTDEKDKEHEDMYYIYFDKYKDFGLSFPIILRWMIQMTKYSSKAFKKFLIKYNTANVSDKKESLILQAEYIVFLYKESQHYDEKNVNFYRDYIIKVLLEEHNAHEKIQEEIKQELEKIKDEKRIELYEYLQRYK